MRMVELDLYYPEERRAKARRLWRYLDLYKFYQLLSEKLLPLPRLDSFSDSFEGIPLGLLLDLQQERDMLGRPVRFHDLLLRKDKLPAATQRRVASYQEIRTSTYVSCWFHSEHESMAMWDLYAGKDGLAISVDADVLIGGLQDHLFQIEPSSLDAAYAGFVEYSNILNFNPETELERMKVSRVALRKHISYAHEQEFRIVFRRKQPLSTKENCLYIKLPGFRLIDAQFYTHPLMPEWKRKNVLSMALKLGLDIPVRPSMLSVNS